MLVLARRKDESLLIGGTIRVTVIDVKGDQVKLGIAAPRHIEVYREELYSAIKNENVRAASPSDISKVPEVGAPLKQRAAKK